jgi:hypothetical protein
MITPEMYLALGFTIVVGSLFALAAAQHARGWFFTPDPRAELQLIEARARSDEDRVADLAAERRTRIARYG